MANYTANQGDSSILNINSKRAIRAANLLGQGVLDNLLDFAKGGRAKPYTTLRYVASSLAWVDSNRRIMLFNIAEGEELQKLAIELVKRFNSAGADTNTTKVEEKEKPKLKQKKEKVEPTPVVAEPKNTVTPPVVAEPEQTSLESNPE